MAKGNDILDLSSLDLSIEGEPDTWTGLRKRRDELESIVAPLVSNKKSIEVISFRGKRRYLKPGTYGSNRDAIHALQFLYRLESAVDSGDTDTIVRLAIGFGSADHEVQHHKTWGINGPDAIIYKVRSKQARIKTRLGKTELRDVPDVILETAVSRHRGRRDWLKQTTEEIIRHRAGRRVTTKTVGTELRLRGIHPDQTSKTA